MNISEKDIEKISKLAKINMDDSEKRNAQEQLQSIFNWIDNLNAIDVDGIDLFSVDKENLMYERKDTVLYKNDVQNILKNAPSSNFDMFCVPKVVE